MAAWLVMCDWPKEKLQAESCFFDQSQPRCQTRYVTFTWLSFSS